MPTFFQMFRVEVEDGIALGDGELVTIALYGPGETIDPSDGADLRIIDSNGNGLVDADEFRDATGGGGLGLNGGGTQLLFDGEPGSGNDGFLYSPLRVAAGEDINSFIDDLGSSFDPVDLDDVATDDPDQPPGPVPICFAAGTLILTPDGTKPVQTLQTGDLVETRDHGAQPLLWAGGHTLSPSALARRPQSRPVRIRRGALGHGLPDRDLIVSPQHRILVASPIARRMTGSDEVLIAASKLAPLDGIDVLDAPAGVAYHHLLFNRHEIVIAEGAPSESLFNGPMALASLARIPGAPDPNPKRYAPARPILIGRKAKTLIARHRKNAMPLLASYRTVPDPEHT